MIALCGDNRKPQVRSAKKYFATKTREAETVIPQQSDRIKELELEVELAKTQKYLLDKRSTIMDLHGLGVLAQLEGREFIEVEKSTVEVIDKLSGRTHRVMNAKSLKSYVKQTTGQPLKSKKQMVDALKQLGRDDLLIPVRRQTVTEDINADSIDEAIAVVFSNRQLLIGQ